MATRWFWAGLMVCALVELVCSQAPPFPCDPMWPRPLYYPNYNDCSTFWECSGGQMSLTQCDPSTNTVFDFAVKACVIDGPDVLYSCQKLLGLA